jgi:hypothetical protein
MAERGVEIDHATLNRWVVKFSPVITANAQSQKTQPHHHGEGMKPAVLHGSGNRRNAPFPTVLVNGLPRAQVAQVRSFC